MTYLVLALGGVAVALTWRGLHDLVEGLYFRTTGAFRVGDDIHVEEVRGRVQTLGNRGIVVETSEGKLAFLPYGRLASATVFRSAAREHTAFHVFRLTIPPSMSLSEAKQRVREAALLCHWSSFNRLPHCVVAADGQLEIMVFAIDSDRVAEIERAVRRALADAPVAADSGS